MIEPLTYLTILASIAVALLAVIGYYLQKIREDVATMRAIMWKRHFGED